ncbi:MAG TPA: hypothetical protein VJU77_17025 [Chthoniobacterales bacterium]|nr:hypothetical protein [Chthoniobacterales bacterium]
MKPLLRFLVGPFLFFVAATAPGQSALDGFDPNANGTVRVVVVQPDGKILIGGDFTMLAPNGGPTVMRNRIARLNPDGTLDSTFDPNANNTVNSIAVQADGKIVTGGSFTTIGGQQRNRIARLDAVTGLADSFDSNASSAVFAIAVQADGKILAGGFFTNIGGQPRSRLARLDPVTGLADSWDPNPTGTGTVIYSIVVQADGNILAGGFFNDISGQARRNLARIDPMTGAADSFDPQASDEVRCLAIQADGQVIAGGFFTLMGGQSRNSIARLDATTGAADSFNPNANNGVFTLAVQTDGRILAGGDFFGIGGQQRHQIARLDPVTGLADSFNPNGNNSVNAIAVQPDGKILMGGSFTTLAPNGGAPVTRNHIARVLDGPTGTPTPTASPSSTPIPSPSPSATPTSTVSPTGTPIATPTPSATATPSPGSTATATATPAPTPTATCPGDVWTNTATASAPTGRETHTAVWTGTEMIVWGGTGASGNVNTGGRYNPGADSWTATSTSNAPTPRQTHTAIWTGAKMIVWGGLELGGNVNTGANYDSGTDSWTATSALNAPGARSLHTVVWTGSKMIVWGGFAHDDNGDHYLDTGGIYDPATDSWTAMSTTNAPTGRYLHAAVWTGNEMIVWGGYGLTHERRTGGIYNPTTDSWRATSITNAPTARFEATAVWTGSEMIVWGGFGGGTVLDSGGRYNPVTDSWTTISIVNAPPGRNLHTAVWTGTEMLVWAGRDNNFMPLNSGGRYNLSTDSWTPISPHVARYLHTAVWTGSEMIVWGGYYTDFLNTGGRYCAAPATPTPTPLPTAAPGSLGNISTRLRVLSGDNALIGGMIATGTANKKVIIRAIGPTLTDFGVPGALQDPTLELYQGSTLITSNDDWQQSPQQAEIQNSGLAPGKDAESAIIATLTPNQGYTAIVRGKDGTTGVGVVEAFDLEQGSGSKLGNISTRGFVDVDDNVMIAGLIVSPSNGSNTKVLVRALGPTLGDFGVSGFLANPTLDLVNASGTVIRSNNDWKDDAQQRALIEAAGLAPNHDEEAALVETVPPGAYTAIVRGNNRATGVGLVEVYNIP